MEKRQIGNYPWGEAIQQDGRADVRHSALTLANGMTNTDENQGLSSAIADAYDLRGDVTCILHRHGCNRMYRVSWPKGQAWLRWQAGEPGSRWAKEAEVLQENDAIRKCSAGVVLRRDGQPVGKIGAGCGIMFHHINGLVVEPATVESAEAMGKTLGTVHNEAVTTDLTHSGLDIQDELMSGIKKHAPGSVGELSDICRQISECLSAVPRAKPHFGFIHGDFHAGNTLISADGKALLVDWEWCGQGYRSIDLAVFQHTCEKGIRDPGKRLEVWSRFVGGYGSVDSAFHDVVHTVPLGRCLRAMWQAVYAFRTPERRQNGYEEQVIGSLIPFLSEKLGAFRTAVVNQSVPSTNTGHARTDASPLPDGR